MMLSGQSTRSYVIEVNQQALPISEAYCFEMSLSLKSNYIFRMKRHLLKSSNFGTGLDIPDSQYALAFSQSNQRKQDFKEISSSW